MVKIDIPDKKDCEGIAAIMIENGYSNFYKTDNKKELTIILQEEIKNKNFLIAKIDNEVIGYSIMVSVKGFLKDAPIKINQNYAYSKGIGVKKAFRKKGIGRHLKKATITLVKILGYSGMYTDVGMSNVGSIDLQLKTGFVELIRYKSKSRDHQGGKNIIFVIDF